VKTAYQEAAAQHAHLVLVRANQAEKVASTCERSMTTVNGQRRVVFAQPGHNIHKANPPQDFTVHNRTLFGTTAKPAPERVSPTLSTPGRYEAALAEITDPTMRTFFYRAHWHQLSAERNSRLWQDSQVRK
jgi:hypothetical protein